VRREAVTVVDAGSGSRAAEGGGAGGGGAGFCAAVSDGVPPWQPISSSVASARDQRGRGVAAAGRDGREARAAGMVGLVRWA
jgi:hypothetical protein